MMRYTLTKIALVCFVLKMPFNDKIYIALTSYFLKDFFVAEWDLFVIDTYYVVDQSVSFLRVSMKTVS